MYGARWTTEQTTQNSRATWQMGNGNRHRTVIESQRRRNDSCCRCCCRCCCCCCATSIPLELPLLLLRRSIVAATGGEEVCVVRRSGGGNAGPSPTPRSLWEGCSGKKQTRWQFGAGFGLTLASASSGHWLAGGERKRRGKEEVKERQSKSNS